MSKVDVYKIIKVIFYSLHIYLLLQLIGLNYDLLNTFYLPFMFSAITSLLTYIINTQSRKKSSNYLIFFLLAGSTTFASSSGLGLDNKVMMIILSISFQLSGWYFQQFVFETLRNKRIIKRQQSKTWKINQLILFTIIIFDVISLFLNMNISINFTFSNMDISLNIIRIIYIIYFFINISTPLLQIIRLLINKKTQHHKTFLLWMLFIPTIAFGPFVFFNALPLLFGEPWIDSYVAAVAFFAIPFGYTYLILTKKLLDLTFVFNRIIYYGGMALFPSLFISIVLVLLISTFHIFTILQTFVIIYVFHILYLLIKERFDFYFRRFLFHDKSNNVQFIERIGEELSRIMTLKDLENFIINEIGIHFNTTTITVIDYQESLEQIKLKHLVGKLDVTKESLKQAIEKNKEETFINIGRALGIFLTKNNSTSKYLWIEKQNDRSLTINEKSWFILFSSYIRLTYENIVMNEQYVKQITNSKEQTSASLSRFLFHFAETERKKLAGDIHDTILQDQIYIYRKLDELAQNNHPELVGIRNGLKNIIDKTRQTCSELLPNDLSNNGLSFSLAELLEQFKQKGEFQLIYEVDISDDHFVDYEKPIAIYRVIEELLNNSIKHSDAERVSVTIWESDQQICIDYLDDGKGFHFEEVSNKDRIGLKGMVERIKSNGGEIEFETQIPENVKIYITIPR
ncbi:sensor histidine kinase [Pseudogracilibacillus auburnensis]|uniref:sensor histidine kinase n=1 Tax=Pseudogracilibacillus auburnensis TaxID=1494959 RepID=UPI001A96C240|nr:ATP-binding protein [Pseudogracilibacillus auburnensis]MBO1004535.1 hypothetical protein [Pseudogracilibacillus auburnensis]